MGQVNILLKIKNIHRIKNIKKMFLFRKNIKKNINYVLNNYVFSCHIRMQTLLSGIEKMILLVQLLSKEKISSQISIILWFSGPSQCIINVYNIHRIKKH